MSFDITKLTPAPWLATDFLVVATKLGGMYDGRDVLHTGIHGGDCSVEERLANAAFAAPARNDLDVKMRRGWHTERVETGDWFVPQIYLAAKSCHCEWAVVQNGHDVGLLTMADRWYSEHVEKTCTSTEKS